MRLTARDLGTFSDVAMPEAVDSCAWMGKEPGRNMMGEEGGEAMVSMVEALSLRLPGCLSAYLLLLSL